MSERDLDRLDWLWRRGSLEAIGLALERAADAAERETLYRRAFAVAQRWRPSVAREIGERYLEEFTRDGWPFGAGNAPDAALLWDLADLFAGERRPEMAAWVCEFALAYGVTGEGSARDFAARARGIAA